MDKEFYLMVVLGISGAMFIGYFGLQVEIIFNKLFIMISSILFAFGAGMVCGGRLIENG